MDVIQFPLSALIISILLLFLFFSKKNVKNDETHIYGNMLIVNFAFSLLGVVIVIIAIAFKNNLLVGVLQKIYLSFMLLFLFLILVYNLVISKKIKYKNINILLIANIIIMLIVNFLPIHVINDNGYVDGYGPSYDFAFLLIIVYFVLIFITTCIIFVKYRKDSTKEIPFVILILLYIIGFAVRKYLPSVIFETFFLSFMMLVMYFTIENPDVKVMEELLRSKELNDKVNTEKSNIMYRITDTIRKPISEIKEISDYILTQDINNNVKYAATDIKDKSYELYNTVNSILNISSSDTRAINITENSYNVKNLFGGVYLQLKPEIKEGVDFRLELSDTIPEELFGDSVKIKQIVNTIVLNSAKYTDKGFIELGVDAIVKYDICKLIITIEDTGIGMDIDKVNKLLEVKEALSEEELKKLNTKDLNIDIVNKLVYMIGGTISIKSVKKEGTKVTISLDQKIKEDKKDEHIKKLYDYGSHEFNKKKVVLVTEKEDFGKKISKMLSDQDINLEIVYYAKDVLDKVREGENINLIITEENLSKIGGHLLMEKLNKERNFNGKVVLISDEENPDLINNSMDEGFYRVLKYDFKKTDLSNIIKKI